MDFTVQEVKTKFTSFLPVFPEEEEKITISRSLIAHMKWLYAYSSMQKVTAPFGFTIFEIFWVRS